MICWPSIAPTSTCLSGIEIVRYYSAEEITIPVYAKHLRYGSRAGQPNPHFLDPKTFMEFVLQPYREAKFLPHTGPFLFEFQRHGLPADEFFSRLDAFLGALPKDFRYSIELRNPGLLGERYARLLEKHGVAHVYIIGVSCQVSRSSINAWEPLPHPSLC